MMMMMMGSVRPLQPWHSTKTKYGERSGCEADETVITISIIKAQSKEMHGVHLLTLTQIPVLGLNHELFRFYSIDCMPVIHTAERFGDWIWGGVVTLERKLCKYFSTLVNEACSAPHTHRRWEVAKSKRPSICWVQPFAVQPIYTAPDNALHTVQSNYMHLIIYI